MRPPPAPPCFLTGYWYQLVLKIGNLYSEYLYKLESDDWAAAGICPWFEMPKISAFAATCFAFSRPSFFEIIRFRLCELASSLNTNNNTLPPSVTTAARGSGSAGPWLGLCRGEDNFVVVPGTEYAGSIHGYEFFSRDIASYQIMAEASTVRRGCVERAPEYGQARWARIAMVASEAPPPRALRSVRRAELAEKPRWIVLRGRVYDIEIYRPYHPGGDEILRSFGALSGDELFDAIHPWVNAEFLLASCLIGPLAPDEDGVEQEA